MSTPTSPLKTYEVRVRCTITKLVTCEDCTEPPTDATLWDTAASEHETEQHDYEIISVKEVE